MRDKKTNYTLLGKRIAAIGGTQDKIAEAIGLNRAQVSRKLHGKIPITAEELMKIADHFDVPVALFFGKPDMDGTVLIELYRMFQFDAIAFDWIIEAFKKDHSNLAQLGEIAEALCKEE